MKINSNHNLVRIFFILLINIFSFQLANAKGGSGSGPRFSLGMTIMGGQGQMGNGVDVLDRDMIFTPIGLFLGFNIKKFRIGGNYEYYIAGQSTDPATVSNQNISGKGGATGVRLDYYDGKQSFGVIYRMSDTYTLDKATAAGNSVTYSSTSGYSVQYYRQIKKRFGIVLDYTSETFDTSLPNSVKWSRMGIGIVISNFTSSK